MLKRPLLAAVPAVLAVLLNACSSGGSSAVQSLPKAPSPGGDVLPTPAPPSSSVGSLKSGLPQNSPYIRVNPDGSILHIDPLPQVRAAYAAPAQASPNVDYHKGPVIHTSTSYAIFWRPSGYYMSPKYETVIEQFYHDIGSTPMYGILPQYYDTTGHPLNKSTFGGAWTDTQAFPAKFDDAAIRQEVARAIQQNNWPKGGVGAVFFVFTASKAKDSFAYCAYHGDFVSSGNPVVYSIVPYQRDLGPHGCGTPSKVFPNDQDADLTIDTMWHEFAESVSDPTIQGWYRNSDGQEIGDLCNTSYGPLRKDGSDVTLHGHDYVTQEIWSNHGSECEQTYE